MLEYTILKMDTTPMCLAKQTNKNKSNCLYYFKLCSIHVQLARILTENNVSFTSVTLLSVYVASISLTFEVKLNSLADHRSGLAEFMEYFNSGFDTLGDYNIFEGSKGSLSIVISGIDNNDVHSLILVILEGKSNR